MRLSIKNKYWKNFSPIQKLVIYYCFLIVFGTLLLCLPIAANNDVDVHFIDAFFVATSATCVTGLATINTLESWSFFGQLIILSLIQLGGIGISAFIVILLDIGKRKNRFQMSRMIKEDMNADSYYELNKRIKRLVFWSIFIELIGAFILSVQFLKKFDLGTSIWYGLFHAISAYCNAGFDLVSASGTSLISYNDNAIFIWTIMTLIVVGGLGFPVLEECWLYLKHKFTKGKYVLSFHSQIVLITTLFLILVGAGVIFLLEYNNTFVSYDLTRKVSNAFFLSITARTAGFTTIDLMQLVTGSKVMTIILMFIGGAPASTAGGIKVTTFFVVIMSILSYFRGAKDVTSFYRRVSKENIMKSFFVFMSYIILINFAVLCLSMTEAKADYMALMFEVVSAIGTVGSSLNLSADLTVIGKVIIILLMFIGRLGALTIGITFLKREKIIDNVRYPRGNILIG